VNPFDPAQRNPVSRSRASDFEQRHGPRTGIGPRKKTREAFAAFQARPSNPRSPARPSGLGEAGGEAPSPMPPQEIFCSNRFRSVDGWHHRGRWLPAERLRSSIALDTDTTAVLAPEGLWRGWPGCAVGGFPPLPAASCLPRCTPDWSADSTSVLPWNALGHQCRALAIKAKSSVSLSRGDKGFQC